MGRRHPRPSWALFPLTRLSTIKITSPRKPRESKEYVTQCIVEALTTSNCPKWESDRSTSSTISTVTFPFPASLISGATFSVDLEHEAAATFAAATVGEVTPVRVSSTTKHVHFGEAHVRVYPQILGDHPYCSMGCPLELSWEFQREETHSADQFGESQNQWCHKLTAEERLAIVQPHCTEAEVRKACRRRNRDICEGRQGLHRQQKRLQKEFFCAAPSDR